MRWSPSTRQLGLVAAAVGIIVLGIAAERQRYPWSDTHDWVPDLLVGWTVVGLGIAALTLGRPRGAALLLALCGSTWFAGNFFALEPEWLGSTASHFSWVFLAPLIQLSLGYPTGRPRTRLAAAGAVGGWLAVVAPGLDWSDETTRAVALGAFFVLGIVVWLRAQGRARRDAAWGLVALAGLLAWSLVAPWLGTAGSFDLATLALDSTVVLVGIWLFAGLPSRGALAERVIELDESTGTVESALASLLDDPGLRIGYRSDAGFVDDDGRPVPVSIAGRVTTEIDGTGGPVAIVVHDALVLSREDDRQAVSVAVALAAERARLREEVRARADDIARSTLRLLRAEDDARAKIAALLAVGPSANLAACARLVDEARLAEPGDAELDAAMARTADQLAHAEEELAAFAGGLGVPALDAGLPAAVRSIAGGLPLSVDVRVDEFECPTDLASTIWFVCAEGVANVLKHADASRLLVEIVDSPRGISVTIEDDGRGGVDPAGSGLAGLRDRIAAHGGRLAVENGADGGTRLVAVLNRSAAA